MKIKVYFSVVFVCLMLTAGTAEADTVTVSKNDEANYTIIQEAINNVKDGDTILVYSGNFTENVIVNKSVSIKSNSGNPDDTIIQSSNPGEHIFNVTEDDVTISGFKITGASNFVTSPTAGVHLEGVNNSIISNNKFSNNIVGIDLHSSDHNMLSNNTVSDNERGISLTNSNNNTVINNDAFNNRFGIYFWGSKNNILSDNNASLNEEDGIWIEDGSNNNTLSNNMVSNSDDGILLTESSNNNTMSGNNVTLSLVGVQITDSSNNMVKNNFISNNSRIGISIIRNSSNNTVKDNSLSNNSESIVMEGSTNQIYNNKIKESKIHDTNASQIAVICPFLIVVIFGIAFVFLRKE
ncbi:nitrous oxide reductase family maturation protein NosD [Methanosarcina sp.]|uniref:right-handed parallel beta-helix repeat-containing protein n=2 Tax=Methanosarcina sp. TaxID=2213 RepID=UPI0029890004|nr:NosD domain-containing protein [Methanosarcina sp.]MDW5549709.1 NosD domain-containing protein [Methanosarcina sp.]MDW5552890.1 NosD domain-containing protein [Methanosarcina sp.]MDW5558096.1 NosD domain-containing protein [Methanosarcina sp.]